MPILTIARGVPVMESEDFLRQLPEVQDLTDNDECPICMQKYVPTNAPAPGFIKRLISIAVRQESEQVEPEHAVRLPCQHVMGSNCIERWISSAAVNHKTCPYCVQTLFSPASYQFHSDPEGSALFEIMESYGFTADPRGRFWQWDETQGRTKLSAQDVMDSVDHADGHARMIKRYFGKTNRKTLVRRMAAARLTSHLRQTLAYLTLLSRGAPLAELGRVSLQYPYKSLDKHQLDAMYHVLKRSGLVIKSMDRATWEKMRMLGMIDPIKWENDY